MADILADIYGTEKDKVNCSFYFKIGACRHGILIDIFISFMNEIGDKCSRKHARPTFSPTILIPNLYQNPAHDPSCVLSAQKLQEHFDLFYEDFFIEMATKYGQVEELHVCDNVGDHLVGNVYVRFRREEDAKRACNDLNNRFYDRRPLYVELSPVSDFREACCRQYDNDECNRGGFCNFMHVKRPSPILKRSLFEAQRLEQMNKRARSRSP